MFREVKNSFSKLSLMLLIVTAAFLLWGCDGGGSGYDAPEATQSAPLAGQTQSVLIDAATLKAWVDAGLVNNDESYENVVILTAGGTYDAGHIPGAQNWSLSGMERWEGPVYSGNMVLDGPTMDAMLCEYGIDERTTIVFAGSGNPSRLYFNFRYWGFPKDRLKVLNGNQAAWTDAGYALTTVVPAVAETTFGVGYLPAMNPDVRASLDEVIKAVDNDSAVPLNTYGATNTATPAVKGIFADYSDGDGPNEEDASVTADYTIFQGTILGAQQMSFVPDLYVAGNRNGEIESAANIQASLELLGIDGSKPIITYCRAGNLAAQGFMPIDVTVGWDVMVYDGSWSQWGSLTNETDLTLVPSTDYTLPAELSEWATDVLTTGNNDGVTIEDPFYNYATAGTLIEQPRLRVLEGVLTPYDDGANTIEIEDLEHFNSTTEDAAPTSTSGSSGGGC
ncbi:MAG: selenite/tellurite reduction operon rhodanese-like protein ExtH [Desulfuromusa sp.]|nr:selenite/tellurite reduction operon rhodanese-like protein ExtH [Desulfuromusa sp.]